MVSQDVPPFCNATGDRATLHGLNLVGLKRRGFSAELVRDIKRAYRIMFHSGLKRADAVARVRAEVAGIARGRPLRGLHRSLRTRGVPVATGRVIADMAHRPSERWP